MWFNWLIGNHKMKDVKMHYDIRPDEVTEGVSVVTFFDKPIGQISEATGGWEAKFFGYPRDYIITMECKTLCEAVNYVKLRHSFTIDSAFGIDDKMI